MATRKRSSAKRAPLAEYKAKRDFSKTDEPAGGAVRSRKGPRLRFVIQKHAAVICISIFGWSSTG